jgi:hypothetical protein
VRRRDDKGEAKAVVDGNKHAGTVTLLLEQHVPFMSVEVQEKEIEHPHLVHFVVTES